MDSTKEPDVVTDEWLARHAIPIPRAAGVWQSPTAWVRIDAQHRIVAAGEKDQTVLAWLVERQTLSNADVDYGIAFVTCRNAHRKYRGERGCKSYLDLPLMGTGNSLSCEQAAEVFSLVRTELGRKYYDIVVYACDTLLIDHKSNRQPPFRQAFTALARAFDNASRAVRENKA